MGPSQPRGFCLYGSPEETGGKMLFSDRVLDSAAAAAFMVFPAAGTQPGAASPGAAVCSAILVLIKTAMIWKRKKSL
jgi:hypothetical protein